MATAAALGWKACPAASDPAQCDTPAWSRRLFPGNVHGPQAEQYGARSGTLLAPMDLTIRMARSEYCCQDSCGHLIQPGQLCGSSADGGRKFCACCVTTEKPPSEFIPRHPAA